jgi:hypothetical protein
MPRNVKLAILLAFTLNGVLILTAQYRLSYDAYNHMFFADHYLQDWWSLWDVRWYTGFPVTSYPPLVHQLIALLGRVIGVDAGFGLLLWAVASLYPLAMYRFARIFTGGPAAGWAALGTALLPSVYLVGLTFGQLPTLVATLLTLWGAAVLDDFLRQGDSLSGALLAFLTATLMAAHHATLLFLPAVWGAVFLRHLTLQNAQYSRLVLRFFTVALGSTLAALVVVWPFWQWGQSQALQTPIDHQSRHNFLTDPMAALLFFLPMYGLFIPLIPVGVWLGRFKRFWGLGLAFLFLFVLGLGGTTPLPRLLFGASWTWLTYDRFAFWASLLLMPFLGTAAAWSWSRRRIIRNRPLRWAGVGVLAVACLVIGLTPSWLPTQPTQIDMQPMVDFLNRQDHSSYRYLTFGFGDQLAYLSRLTSATTIDGSYHTARDLPELRDSGIGQIDTAYWIPGGLAALDPILQLSGSHGVKWAFVDLKKYDPVLWRNGWVEKQVLSNGIQIWENPRAVLPPPVPIPPASPFQAFSWGVFPLAALLLTGGLAVRHYGAAKAGQVLGLVRAIAIALLPVSLFFWYYRTLVGLPHERIYFTYSDALFFLSDGIALLIVLTWGIERWPSAVRWTIPARLHIRRLFSTPDGWLLGLWLLATVSMLWSLDWRVSLYFSLHLGLCFGFYRVLRQEPQAWRWFALGCCAALVLQAVFATWQFAVQSTEVSLPLRLEWPGDLLPADRGASVVQLANGLRWLRAYGTLPHPNLLGGFGLIALSGPLALLFTKRRVIPLVLFMAALAVLVLSFSRSAWLGMVALVAVVSLNWKRLRLKQLILPAVSSLVTLGVLLIWLSPLFLTRVVDSQVQTEQVSTYTRLWLVQQTLDLIRTRPLLGSGAGTYSIALAGQVAPIYQIEPVHDIPLLVTGELGPAGLILLGGLVFVVARAVRGAHTGPAVVLSGLTGGLLVISLLDHYFWTLAPGRLAFFTVLGLWAGQVKIDENRG